MPFVPKAKKGIETVTLRMEIGSPAQMPFADQTGGVSLIVQSLCDGPGLPGNTGP